MSNTTRAGETTQDWINFCDKIADDLPKSATPVELATFLYWLMLCYKPSTISMQVVLGPVLEAYHRETWEVPNGSSVH